MPFGLGKKGEEQQQPFITNITDKEDLEEINKIAHMLNPNEEVFATISFTIGLVTNESIQLLINFTKDRFGRIKDDASTKPELSIGIEDIQNPIRHGEEQKVTVGVNHNGSAIEEALIRATVINKDSKTIHKFPGFIDNFGRFTYGWRIEPHIYTAGIYIVKLDVSKEGYRSSFITITFEVSNTQKTQINA
jgi:hypothetical protein